MPESMGWTKEKGKPKKKAKKPSTIIDKVKTAAKKHMKSELKKQKRFNTFSNPFTKKDGGFWR